METKIGWGYVDEVRVDGLLAQVRLGVGDQALTAVITADAVRALRLRRGEDALAIVMSTEVMIAAPFERTSADESAEHRGFTLALLVWLTALNDSRNWLVREAA